MIADAKYERAFVEECDCKSPGFNSLNDRLWNERSWRKAVVRMCDLDFAGFHWLNLDRQREHPLN
jgi:hypothetical protein